MDDATKAWKETTKRGAESYFSPRTEKDADGEVIKSGIRFMDYKTAFGFQSLVY